jgi:hypothetical protein
MLNDPTTYRDGIGLSRCSVCHSAIRALTDDPLVMIPEKDVDQMAQGLGEILRHVTAMLEVIEHAIGRRIAQLEAELAAIKLESAEVIGPDVKLDRGGLEH